MSNISYYILLTHFLYSTKGAEIIIFFSPSRPWLKISRGNEDTFKNEY